MRLEIIEIILELASAKGKHKTIPERKKYSRIAIGRQEKDLLLFQFNNRANKSLVVAARLKLLRNLLNSALAVIRNCVQYDSADHKKHLLIPNMGIF